MDCPAFQSLLGATRATCVSSSVKGRALFSPVAPRGCREAVTAEDNGLVCALNMAQLFFFFLIIAVSDHFFTFMTSFY